MMKELKGGTEESSSGEYKKRERRERVENRAKKKR